MLFLILTLPAPPPRQDTSQSWEDEWNAVEYGVI